MAVRCLGCRLLQHLRPGAHTHVPEPRAQTHSRQWITRCLACSYGNNAVEMETTATWNQDAQSFIIDTPSTLAQKYWITNSALHAKWSVVFAQLLMDGKREGVHAFLVRIRHDDMRAVEGVRIEDMGHKMGCNGAHATSTEL